MTVLSFWSASNFTYKCKYLSLLPLTSRAQKKNKNKKTMYFWSMRSSTGVSENSPVVRYIKILTWLRGFRVKIANFSRLHCLAIPRGDLSTKEIKPNKESKAPGSELMDELNRKRAWVLRVTALEFRYSDCQPNVEVNHLCIYSK